ncbi:type II secretion system F family protein [Sneathiella litorea]|uniref:Type II secretion system protein GspF domain-containing protein n=1 Tax=Sneathiella litorea TaxID=2606216 RepID=A0A6L8W9K8_9PROT|nr:type II secretion system F family protein [Sneathiella litorea]MZR31808.1 hypothetical protein [Sneathiella litorea]
MSGIWIESREEAITLSIIAIFLCLSFGFYIKALRAKKSERIDSRLRQFAPETSATVEKSGQLPKIALEREEVETSATPKRLWRLAFGHGGTGKQRLNRRFIRAGIDPRRGRSQFLLARFIFSILSALSAGFLLHSQVPLANNYVASVFIIFAVGVGGSFLPFVLLNYHIRQRQRRIERAMPDMIDLLILCVEAGLTLEVALARAVEGLEPFSPDVAAEMKITLSELRILPDKSMALTNLETRTASPSLKYLVLSLRQSERYGTSITGALKSVAMENRKHAILELENNAARMPALLSIPLILFILPPVVVLSAGPGFVLMMRAIGG